MPKKSVKPADIEVTSEMLEAGREALLRDLYGVRAEDYDGPITVEDASLAAAYRAMVRAEK